MGNNKWKEEVRTRDCFKCKICGSPNNLTIQHKIPLCRGGQSTLENTVCWCTWCHRDYHKKWGMAISDDFGNPTEHGYQHRNSSKRKQSKKQRRKQDRRQSRRTRKHHR